jgi:hypothetical protein
MNRKRWLAAVGIMSIAVGLESCGTSKAETETNGPVEPATKAELMALRDSLATLLGKQGTDPTKSLHAWLKDLATGVCQLEMKAPGSWALDDAQRFCKSTDTGPIDKTTPPPFPPN